MRIFIRFYLQLPHKYLKCGQKPGVRRRYRSLHFFAYSINLVCAQTQKSRVEVGKRGYNARLCERTVHSKVAAGR